MSTENLYRRLLLVEVRVRHAVARRRLSDPDPDDRFRGLYITDAHIDVLLEDGDQEPISLDPDTEQLVAQAEVDADRLEAAGGDVRLRRLARSFDLDEQDVDLLLVALAPDLDSRFERLYGYLNDDVSQRRATIGLALELCGLPHGSGTGRARLGPASPLVSGGLLAVEDDDRPMLTRPLRVPDRVAAFLLGDDQPHPDVARLQITPAGCDWALDGLDAALGGGARLCYVREQPGAAGLSTAADALERACMPALFLDLTRLGPTADVVTVARLAIRDARLAGGALAAVPLDILAEQGAAAVRAFAEAACPTVMVGSRTWDPDWSREVPFVVDAVVPSVEQRAALWSAALDGDAPDRAEIDLHLAAFRLSPERVARAAGGARRHAAAEGRALTTADLQAGARTQNSAGLERLARRVDPRAAWDDLVLPRDVVEQLRELVARARHRELVLEGWGMGASGLSGRSVTALFAGDSGTGKTLSAEVLAGELGLDLYVVDLSAVVDKYIGETEKNLDRIFAEADRVNGVLLFDEADALFGKRSEVSDARDRYANIEVAYLLQRMERFDGVSLLTTNLRANLDEAFTRRLDAIVDFPLPEEEDRHLLWQRKLRPEVPRSDDVDFAFLARAFKLTGGEINNVALTAAYVAAAESRPVTMHDVVRGVAREYRKLGRMCVEAEFGPYYHVLTPAVAGADQDREE